MPANLTPQYHEAEEKYKQAQTPQEQLLALEDMLRIIPKHKGTSKLQAEIKQKISKLKTREDPAHPQSKRNALRIVEKEGGGQVVLLGAPNAGKSSLLAHLTNAHPEIGEYPFTTHLPLPGMMEYEDINIQIVDLPPITEEFTEGWVVAIARSADMALLVVDVGSDAVLDEAESVLAVLEKFRLALKGPDETPVRDETGLLRSQKAILVANKIDAPEAESRLEIIRDAYGDVMPVIGVSTVSGIGLERLKRDIFTMLRVVRVYTKIPGKPADMKSPYVLPHGTTVEELATTVHKDFAQKLRFARIWGEGQHDGIMVSREHILEDRDVIELHV
jgi:hypothetical protein